MELAKAAAMLKEPVNISVVVVRLTAPPESSPSPAVWTGKSLQKDGS